MEKSELYPLLFEPNLHEVVWGGHKLQAWKKMQQDGRPIGESWEVSAVPTSISVIANGRFKGMDLISLINRYPAEILGKKVAKEYDGEMPLLIKFIDAQRDLSIQVHPNDEMAAKLEHKRGKTEMWYIIGAEPGASLLLGFSQKITPEEYEKKVADGTITDVLARHEVHPGDVFFIPAGRVHAICKGILLAEIQQSSDVTYRLYDYNRPGMDGKPRELHTEKAKQVLDYNVYDDYLTHYIHNSDGVSNLITCPKFTTNIVEVHKPLHRDMKSQDSFVVLMGIKGNTRVSFPETDEEIELREGFSALVPASIADYVLTAEEEHSSVIEAYV